MTRFNITLEESVKMVDWAINNAIGGEIVVPKLDSFKVVDLAKAINSKSKLKFIGIKRGEKIHEELLNPNDAPYSLDLGKYYVVLPDNHKKRIQKYKKFKFKKVDKNFSYTSNQKKFLNINQLKKLISNL